MAPIIPRANAGRPAPFYLVDYARAAVGLHREVDNVMHKECFHEMERIVPLYGEHLLLQNGADIGFGIPEPARGFNIRRLDTHQDALERGVRALNERQSIGFAQRQSRDDGLSHLDFSLNWPVSHRPNREPFRRRVLSRGDRVEAPGVTLCSQAQAKAGKSLDLKQGVIPVEAFSTNRERTCAGWRPSGSCVAGGLKMASLREHFVAFRAECVWLRDCYNTFTILFDETETRELLERSAVIFFGDLNRILQEYCYLQVCKITDPASTGERENLTLSAMNVELARAGLMTPEVETHTKAMLHYRSLIKAPRDRLISHLDKKTVLAGATIGGHDAAEVDAFFEALQGYCDAVGRLVGEGPLDFRWSAGAGDAIDLLRVLKKVESNGHV